MALQLAPTDLLSELEQDGIVILPDLVIGEALRAMQTAFDAVLAQQRWNDIDGYEKTEPYRHVVNNVLTIEQGFVDVALHSTVLDTLRRYIGPGFQLVEAKGWKTIPVNRDFHGWHGDAWYDQSKVTKEIPREVKLALYLTDVQSGFFEYVRGSHRRQAPRPVRDHEVAGVPADEIVQVRARAGTAFMFDTSGVHRQSVPVLEARHAVFYDYHDPQYPIQAEDVAYYRYHPLLLNAAFLGGLTEEERRVLGFGDKRTYVPAFRRRTPHRRFHRGVQWLHDAHLRANELLSRVIGRARYMLRLRG